MAHKLQNDKLGVQKSILAIHHVQFTQRLQLNYKYVAHQREKYKNCESTTEMHTDVSYLNIHRRVGLAISVITDYCRSRRPIVC